MNTILLLASSALISVFAHFVENTAAQRGISLDEAASMLYNLGIRGYDIDADSPNFEALAATKLKPINIYYLPQWLTNGDDEEHNLKCLNRASSKGVPRIMIVAPEFTGKADKETEFLIIEARLKKFVAAAKARGITVTVEDFGFTGTYGYCCNRLSYIERFLKDIPDLKVALDSGNFFYNNLGDDILELMKKYRDRIVHVHLKDQPAEDHHKFVSLGMGAVPNREIVRYMKAAGYEGWWTLEEWEKDAYFDAIRQVNVFKAYYEGK